MATRADLGPDDPVEYDPFSWEIDRDPYPVYRWMRDHAPVYYDERQDFHALTRFDDVLAALVDSSWTAPSRAPGS